jgi:hypothetical protein
VVINCANILQKIFAAVMNLGRLSEQITEIYRLKLKANDANDAKGKVCVSTNPPFNVLLVCILRYAVLSAKC